MDSIKEYFENLQPFKSIDDIPDIPRITETDHKIIVENLIRCGAIPKSELIIGKSYLGNCRNTNLAVWNGKEFVYERYKFGTKYLDRINHFEDDDGYDLFIPLCLVYERT